MPSKSRGTDFDMVIDALQASKRLILVAQAVARAPQDCQSTSLTTSELKDVTQQFLSLAEELAQSPRPTPDRVRAKLFQLSERIPSLPADVGTSREDDMPIAEVISAIRNAIARLRLRANVQEVLSDSD